MAAVPIKSEPTLAALDFAVPLAALADTCLGPRGIVEQQWTGVSLQRQISCKG